MANMEQMYYQDRTIEEIKINNVLRNRTIYLNDEINSDAMFKFCYYLSRIEEIDIKNGISKDKLEPIYIVGTSYGGSIYDGLAGISKLEYLIEQKGYKIITTIQGYAMSMCQAIMIVATERRAYNHSRIMIHQPSSGTYGKLKDMEEDIEETLQLWIKMKEIIKKYSNMTESQLEEIKKSKEDKFMWSQEALELGIIDIIL